MNARPGREMQITSSSVRDHLLDEKALGKHKRRIPGPI
jgi:hypothetical protein